MVSARLAIVCAATGAALMAQRGAANLVGDPSQGCEGDCASTWDACYDGDKFWACCDPADECILKNEFYAQCRPVTALLPDWPLAQVLPGCELPNDLEDDGTCLPEWAQCGGARFDGDTSGGCCEADNVCMVKNDFYSQCRPLDRPFETAEGDLPIIVDPAVPDAGGAVSGPGPSPSEGPAPVAVPPRAPPSPPPGAYGEDEDVSDDVPETGVAPAGRALRASATALAAAPAEAPERAQRAALLRGRAVRRSGGRWIEERSLLQHLVALWRGVLGA